MKVLLIDPPGFEGHSIGRILGSFGTNKADQVWPPYDLEIMAGYCRKNGHNYRILDANNLKLSYQDIKKEIENYEPDWVIFLTCFPNFLLDVKVATVAKSTDRNIKTACMSLSIFSVENPVERMKELPDLDFILWAEPEIPLMRLINGENPELVQGLYYRDKENTAKFSGEAQKLENLDDLGIPVHSGLPIKIYKCPLALRLPMAIVNSSRGCKNWCVHCQAGAFQRPLRYRSVPSMIEELNELKSLGINEIKFYGCSLPTNAEFIKELCKAMIKSKFDFSWHCNARVEVLNEDILQCMKQAGCHTICVGCESSNSQILKNMRKNETAEQIEGAVKLIKRAGMRVLMYLTFGLEGETKQTMEETFRFVEELKPEFVTFGIAVPAPGTPFHKFLKDKNYLIKKELELMDPNALPAYSYPHLSSEEILNFTRSAYRRYYFRPGYVIWRLINLRSFTEFKVCVTNAFMMVKRYLLESIK